MNTEHLSSARKLSVDFLLNEPTSSGYNFNTAYPIDGRLSPHHNDDRGTEQEIGIREAAPGGTKLREPRGRREATRSKKSAPKYVKPNVRKATSSFSDKKPILLKYQATTTTSYAHSTMSFVPIDPAMLETLPVQKGSIPIVLPRFSSPSPPPSDGEAAGTGKRRSPSPSSVEYDYLEQVFSINPRPDSKTKQWIAKRLGMDLQHVCGWFQNKRNRMRKMQKKERPKATPLVFHHFLL